MAKDQYSLGQVTMRTGGMRGGRAVEKPHDFRKAWIRILSYGKAYRPQIIVILVSAVTAVLLLKLRPKKKAPEA